MRFLHDISWLIGSMICFQKHYAHNIYSSISYTTHLKALSFCQTTKKWHISSQSKEHDGIFFVWINFLSWLLTAILQINYINVCVSSLFGFVWRFTGACFVVRGHNSETFINAIWAKVIMSKNCSAIIGNWMTCVSTTKMLYTAGIEKNVEL